MDAKVVGQLDDNSLKQAVIDEINKMDSPKQRWHALNHLFRYLETIKICPPGPAKVLDLGFSPIYCAVLRAYQYSIDYISRLNSNVDAAPASPYADLRQRLCETSKSGAKRASFTDVWSYLTMRTSCESN